MNRQTIAALFIAASTGLLTACSDPSGSQSAAPIQAAENKVVATQDGGYDLYLGKTVFTKTCLSCHKDGADGAPALNDIDQWKRRIEQDTETLIAHAINGHGRMPPKGGYSELNDVQVASAVHYVVARSRDIVAALERRQLPPDCHPVRPKECEPQDMEDVMTLQMLWLLGTQGQGPLP